MSDDTLPRAVSPSDAPPRTGRLFYALWPDEATQAQLLQWQRAQRWPERTRPTPARDLHLTLHFIGAIDPVHLDTLRTAPMPPIDIELTLTQPALWREGLAVLLGPAVPPALQQLHEAMGQWLQQQGLPHDTRPYRPHVTMARAAGGVSLQMPGALHWRSSGHVLAMRSGPHYQVLQRWPTS